MNYHEAVSKILELLNQHGCTYRTFEHEPVRTSDEAAKTRPGYSLKQGAKAMIVRAKTTEGKKFVMLVFPADQKFDNAKVRQALGAKDIRFATEEEIFALTGGVLPGAVPPFGNLFKLPVYADPLLFENEEMVFNAGDRSFSIAMKTADYKKMVDLNVVNLI